MPHKGIIRNLAPSADIRYRKDLLQIVIPSLYESFLRITEEDDLRITEDGDPRVLEDA